MSPAADASPSLGWSGRLCIAFVVTLMGIWTVQLWPEWRHNPDLSHGLFTPVIFLLLLREARLHGPQRFLTPGVGLTSAIIALLIAGLGLLTLGGLYAAALEWTHALVSFLLSGALCAFLGASLLAVARVEVRWIPFNWSSAVAVSLWLLSAPLPPGTYTMLTQQLQDGVTTVVLSVLHLLGVAALRDGNVIELANVSVGVEEACSGIRSLISCVFAGLFFSASLVRRPWQRVLLLALSAPLAIVMNVLRSLTLTLLANAGVEIRGAWHDLTGFAILGVTALVLAGLALLLESRDRPTPQKNQSLPGNEARREGLARPHRGAPPFHLLTGGLGLALLLVGFFFYQTRPARQTHGNNGPDLSAALPIEAEGWQVVTSDDLYRFSDQLQTDQLLQRTYAKSTPTGPLQVTVYLAYWPAGKAPVSLVASHTPEACWPGSGWVAQTAIETRVALDLGDRLLPPAEHRLFTQDGFPQQVWYWHLFDGQPLSYRGVGTPRQLLWLAVHYGFRRNGEQLFIRVSSNQSWNKIAHETLLLEVFKRLHPLGL